MTCQEVKIELNWLNNDDEEKFDVDDDYDYDDGCEGDYWNNEDLDVNLKNQKEEKMTKMKRVFSQMKMEILRMIFSKWTHVARKENREAVERTIVLEGIFFEQFEEFAKSQ